MPVKPSPPTTLNRTAMIIKTMTAALNKAATPVRSDLTLLQCGNLIYAGAKSSVCFADRFLTDVAERTSLRVNRKFCPVRLDSDALFDAVVLILMVMAVLLSAVGGLGLMGIMGLNVLERSREIGVMRAIGASDNALLRIILIEGILIGLVSWLVGCVIAYPLSRALSDAVGMAMIQTPFTFTFSAAGVLTWLALIVVLTSAACYIPAHNACQITIRETLAYE